MIQSNAMIKATNAYKMYFCMHFCLCGDRPICQVGHATIKTGVWGNYAIYIKTWDN